MSPLWIEEDEGTCSRPPTMVSSLSDTTCKVWKFWLIPVFALIRSAAGVTNRSVWGAWLPVFPFSSSSTQEPGEQDGGGKAEN